MLHAFCAALTVAMQIGRKGFDLIRSRGSLVTMVGMCLRAVKRWQLEHTHTPPWHQQHLMKCVCDWVCERDTRSLTTACPGGFPWKTACQWLLSPLLMCHWESLLHQCLKRNKIMITPGGWQVFLPVALTPGDPPFGLSVNGNLNFEAYLKENPDFPFVLHAARHIRSEIRSQRHGWAAL